jgi:hypothetical protein
MQDIKSLLFKADTDNGFSKQLVRKYCFTLTFKNYHELSVMFEALHTIELSPTKIKCNEGSIMSILICFPYENNEEKVTKFIEQLLQNEIKVFA